jgi:hypothetical protein
MDVHKISFCIRELRRTLTRMNRLLPSVCPRPLGSASATSASSSLAE